MIKNIVFDFGGVLVDWDPRYFYRTVFADEREMDYFLTHICTPEWNSEHDRGVAYADNIARLQAEHPRYSREIGLFRQGWSRMLRSDKPETASIVHELVSHGYDIYGLTNWPAETIDELFERYDVFSLMKGIVVSGREKIIKPDRRIYDTLLQRYGLRAEECLFIDDNPGNAEAARRAGMHAVCFTDADTLRGDLDTLGLL